MVRLIATVVCALVIWQLFRLTREAEVKTSKALWIPTIWVFLAATRNPSEWFHTSGGMRGQYLEGSPLDQFGLSAMLALGLVVLFIRGQRTWKVLQSSAPVLVFFFYCGMSVSWSDFPDVAFKRLFRALGDVVMILIVLSDSNWLAALRRVLARVGFVAIPLSILFIRYYPELGRSYSKAGLLSWTGVATGKNGLGMICLVFGLAALFRFLQVYSEKKDTRRTGQLIALGAVLAMTLYLLLKANSATSLACFFLAGGPMVLTHFFRSARRPVFVHVMVVAILGTAVSALFLNIGTGLVEELGRESTLTGRTDIWRSAFSLVQNPLFGTGYESFWVGPRLVEMVVLLNQPVNQAHNGYIETYLNLGWVGVALLAVVLVAAYTRVIRAFRWTTPMAGLWLAYFIATVAYNFTEAAFKMMHPLWIAFLLMTMVRPEVPIQGYSLPTSLSLDDAEDLTETKRKASKTTAVMIHRVRSASEEGIANANLNHGLAKTTAFA